MNKTEERATKLIDTPKCLLVEVPENYKDNEITESLKLLFHLPPGSYGSPILASEVSEEHARELVEEVRISVAVPQRVSGFYNFTAYKNYYAEDQYLHHCRTPLESFASLLRSHNLQPSTTVVTPKTI